MTISPQSSKSLYLAILSKVFWKTGGGEKDRWRRVGKIKNLFHAYSYEYVVSPRGKHVPSSPVNDRLVAILLVA